MDVRRVEISRRNSFRLHVRSEYVGNVKGSINSTIEDNFLVFTNLTQTIIVIFIYGK